MKALGRHILAEYFDCAPKVLNDVTQIEAAMLEAALASNATVINSTFHHFSPFGVSGVIVIQESHLAIHTWPEFGYAAVDLFTCGSTVDPWIAYEALKSSLKASQGSSQEIQRGNMGELRPTGFNIAKTGQAGSPQREAMQSSRNVWFTERDENIALSLRHKGERLFHLQSAFQKIEVIDTYSFGKLLTLDGIVVTSENDESAYHEMISHVPLQVIQEARRVLIIGGGDGGAARECLRYATIEELILVEIDAEVVEAARKFLPEIAAELDNPRLELRIEDGNEYVAGAPEGYFDLVIVDSIDPFGPGEGLFSRGFYRHVHRILSSEGLMVSQSQSPRFNTNVFQGFYDCYREIFGVNQVWCYLAFIPTYPSGMWSFALCAKGSVHPLKDLDKEAAKEFSELKGLRYYNSEVHQAAFAMPGFVRDLLVK